VQLERRQVFLDHAHLQPLEQNLNPLLNHVDPGQVVRSQQLPHRTMEVSEQHHHLMLDVAYLLPSAAPSWPELDPVLGHDLGDRLACVVGEEGEGVTALGA
jgi:hypothetical protein